MVKDFVANQWDWKRKLECIREIDPNFHYVLKGGKYRSSTNIMISYDGVHVRFAKSPGHDTEEEVVNEWFHYLSHLDVGGRVVVMNDQYLYDPYTGLFVLQSATDIQHLNEDYRIYGDGHCDFELNSTRNREHEAQFMEMSECLLKHGTLVPPKSGAKAGAMKVLSAVGTGLVCAGGVILAALGLATWRSGRSK